MDHLFAKRQEIGMGGRPRLPRRNISGYYCINSPN